MDNLVSFDMKPDGIERYTVKNLKINPNLEFFERTLKHNFKKYLIRFHCGYIAVYRIKFLWGKELLFFFEENTNHHESRFELVKDLLNLSKDEMQRCVSKEDEYNKKVKNWNNQTEIESFSI